MANITTQPGRWSDPQTWGGALPNAANAVTINHAVELDINFTLSGATVSKGASLKFVSSRDITLQSSKNIVVEGLLEMIASPTNVHILRFINVDESKFVGGGEIPLASDVGLWVMGSGMLNLNGRPVSGWVWANGSLSGSTISASQLGWQLGDEIMITPTQLGSATYDVRNATSIQGANISLSSPISSHPKVDRWFPEVANLTRNVRIEGTPGKQSHVFIRSSSVQNIQFVQFRYLGPRKDVTGDGVKEFVVGRYACHFHHCEDGTRGSVVRGCVARDCDSHAFVPHGSHGILFEDNVAYNVTEAPYWYDLGHKSHDLTYDGNLAALIKYVPRSVQSEDGSPSFGSAGFTLGTGDGNICVDNVVVGTQGASRTDFTGGYNWESGNEGIWVFRNNLAHHCVDGIRVWQNSSKIHLIENYQSYHNFTGIFHGAYVNSYHYMGGYHYGNPLVFHAGSDNSSRIRIENITVDGAGVIPNGVIIEGSPVPGYLPILIRDSVFINCKEFGVLDVGGEEAHNVDIIQSTGTFKVTGPGEVMRIQPKSGQSVRVTNAGTSNIPAFAPTLWGNGKGLKGEYYNDTNFTGLAFIRIDPVINFQEWGNGVHPLITDPLMSVRWTGFIESQFNETYTFTIVCNTGGTADLWIDGKKIIAGNGSGTIALQTGKKFSVKLEFRSTNSARQAGVNFYWNSPSLNNFSPGGEYVPRTQLFSSDTPIPGTTTRTSTTTTSTTTTKQTTKPVTTSTTTTTTTTQKPGTKVIIELLDDGTWRNK